MARISQRTEKDSINPGIFKAYDIRGRYPEEISGRVVFEIARALGKFWRRGVVIVGRDARLSSPRLYGTALSGLKKNKGVRTFSAGVITTPMLSFLVGCLGALGGLMITASHNPKDYNGIKIVKSGAAAMSGREAFKILKRFK